MPLKNVLFTGRKEAEARNGWSVWAMIETGIPNDEQAEFLPNGMENLVGVLGAVCSDLGELKH